MTTTGFRSQLLLAALTLATCLVLPPRARSQVSVAADSLLGRRLDRIEIRGNLVTQDEIILREMELKPGGYVTREQLELDRRHVAGLDLFSRVEFRLQERAGQTVLVVLVTEEWYIFPFPFWDLKPGETPRWTYGFRFVQKNFRGRAETLRARLWGGADRGFRFSHRNPWVKGTPNFTRSLDLFQVTKTCENLELKDLGLEARHTGVQMLFGRRWTRELSMSVGSRFRLVRGEDPRQMASDGEIDRLLELLVSVIYDDRDLRQYPRRGKYFNAWFSHGWLTGTPDRFERFSFDLRRYLPLRDDLSICARLLWMPAWGTLPPYDWTIIKSSNLIRSANLSDEGKSFFLGSLELRFDLLKLRYFSWDEAPFLKRYFRNLQYGLAMELFFDLGDAYQSRWEISRRSLLEGYGAGLLLRLPYLDVLRLEASWNPHYAFNRMNWSWKIGVSF